jgi:hypothetical protein
LLANRTSRRACDFLTILASNCLRNSKTVSSSHQILGKMDKGGFTYPSKCLSLSVKEIGSDSASNISEHSIHECILRQLPYFETLLSERWGSDDRNIELSLELPPISSVVESLYQEVPLPPATDAKRAVGIVALVKMLQHDGLVETALANIRQLTMTDGSQMSDVIAMLENYSTLEDAAQTLKATKVTCDDDVFVCVIRACRNPSHSTLLASAIDSRATFGFRDKDILTILSYMNTPVDLPECHHSKALPFLKCVDPGDDNNAETAKAARKKSRRHFPLSLEATSNLQVFGAWFVPSFLLRPTLWRRPKSFKIFAIMR